MRLWVKLGLFFSSYLPLFLVLAIRNWFNFYATTLFVVTAIYSLIWAVIFFAVKRGTAEKYKVVKLRNKVHESLNYLVPYYIIAFIGFDLTKWQDWTSLFVLLFILFIVYSNSNLLYINPILLLFKYKIYDTELSPLLGSEKPRYEILLITKKPINLNDDVTLKNMDNSNNVF